MRLIKISDEDNKLSGVKYIAATLAEAIKDAGGSYEISGGGARQTLVIFVADKYEDYLRSETEDKIADVITVGYKYDYFKKGIPAAGLKPFEREILYSALIAADIDDDKRYVIRRIRTLKDYALDVIFNFRLTPLKHKWEEVIGYIPSAFTSGQLKEFVRFLVGEKRGKKAIVRNGLVYDGNYNLLERSRLLPALPCKNEGKILREVILSASGRVEVGSEIPEADRRYLRDFYGGRISFRSETDR